MASLYKNNHIWYLSIYHENKRITRSLKTKDIKRLPKLKPLVESQILNEHITGLKKFKYYLFENCSKVFESSHQLVSLHL